MADNVAAGQSECRELLIPRSIGSWARSWAFSLLDLGRRRIRKNRYFVTCSHADVDVDDDDDDDDGLLLLELAY